MIVIDVSKPQGWTERGMSNGWIKRQKTAADSKVAKLKTENEELKSRLDQLEQLVTDLATKKGKNK